MKKAKVILTGIVVLAVVSGALAFKMKTVRTFYSAGTDNLCSVAKNFKYDVTATGTTIAYTTVQNQATPCSAVISNNGE